MNKAILSITGLIAISLTAAFLYFSGKEYVITIPEETILEELDTKLPLTKTYFLIFDITLDNPRVDLIEGSSRINAGLDIVINIKINDQDKPLGGTVDASGSLTYIPEEGAFYLSEPVIERLSVQGIPVKYTKKVNGLVEKTLVTFYSTRPVYKLKSSDLSQAAAKMALKRIVVQDQAAVVTLGI